MKLWQRHLRAYRCWVHMRERCDNPKHKQYASYGGRGIAVCDRWQSFAAFLADMGDPPRGLSIDRIDNNRGYHPGNCRWATRSQQQRNKRTTRLDVAAAATIRAARQGGLAIRNLRIHFPVAASLISTIANGKAWT